MRDRLLAVLLALILAAALGWLWMRDRPPQWASPDVVAQIRQLNHLATVKYTVQKVVGLKEQKQPVGEESILLIVQASVEAGIDLSVMRSDDATIRSDGAVVLRLPPPKILNVSIDEKETKVWDRRKTW